MSVPARFEDSLWIPSQSLVVNFYLNYLAIFIYYCSQFTANIKSLFTLALLRQSVLRVRGAHPRLLRPGNSAPFKEILQRWRVVGNTVSDLTGPRFEPQTSRSRDEHVTALPTGSFTTIAWFQF